MPIEPFGIIVLAIAVLCFGLKPKWTIVAMICLTPFSSAGALTLPGGANVTPGNLFLPFAALKVFKECRSVTTILDSVVKDFSGVLLLSLVLLGLFSAMAYPIAFEGRTEVVCTNRFGDTDVKLPVAEPLTFHSGYLTQPVYALGFLCVFAICYVAAKGGYGADAFVLGLKAAAILNLGMVVFDVLASLVGKPELLEPFRRAAGYGSGEQEMAGFKRLNGAFTEPSALATYSLQLAAPLFYLWWKKPNQTQSFLLSILLLITLGLSTSTTGYIATLACGLILGYLTIKELVAIRDPRRLRKRIGHIANFAFLGTAAMSAAIVVAVLTPSVSSSVEDVFRHTVLEKAESDSGVERGFWATQAIQNCVDTYGLGVGLGGARSNSFVLVLLSNVGVPGLVIAIGFFGSLLFRKLHHNASEAEQNTALMSKAVLVGCLTSVNVSGAVFDIGLLVYIAAGTLAGLDRRLPRRS